MGQKCVRWRKCTGRCGIEVSGYVRWSAWRKELCGCGGMYVCRVEGCTHWIEVCGMEKVCEMEEVCVGWRTWGLVEGRVEVVVGKRYVWGWCVRDVWGWGMHEAIQRCGMEVHGVV